MSKLTACADYTFCCEQISLFLQEDEDWVLDIEDMLERCARTVIASIALIELLDTKLG